jgi:hypothetical protein
VSATRSQSTTGLGEGIDEARVRRAHAAHTRYRPVARGTGGPIETTTDLTIRNAT